MATIQTGSLRVHGAKSAGRVRKLCPPRRAIVSKVLPLRESIWQYLFVRFARVLIRRRVLPPGLRGAGLRVRFERMLRILRRNVSLRLAPFPSIKVGSAYISLAILPTISKFLVDLPLKKRLWRLRDKG